MNLTLEDGVQFCRKIEPVLRSIGYHCALTGSLLYKGESSKDADIIVYPHDPKARASKQEILEALKSAGVTERLSATPSCVNRDVSLCGLNDKRVDLFFF